MPRGTPIRVILQNEGSADHDWQVKELHAQIMEEMHSDENGHGHDEDAGLVHMYAVPGASEHMEFIAEESGTFEIVCTIPGHAEAGMVGTLIVG